MLKYVKFFGASQKRLRIFGGGVVLLTALITTVSIQSCSIPGPKAEAKQIAALTRDELSGSVGVPRVSYLHAGDEREPRVIYIHGTPGEAGGWADFLVEPVKGLEAIAVDRPGFGKSGGQDGRTNAFEMQARALEPLLEKRHGKWPTLVGHSLGGPIAARLAAMYPERVSGLVIVAGSLDPAMEKPGIGQQIATTGFVRFFLPRMLDNSMGELSDARRQTELLAPELAKIACPVIVIHGTKDQLVPYANVAYIRERLIGARSVEVVTLEGQGHFVPWEHAEVIREAVTRLRDLR